jgi:DNA-binding SARP family transcriptional activator/Flp pilus assembly protein TadD
MADPETRAPALRLTLMGRFQLTVGEAPVAVASRRGRGLLSYLSFAGPSGVTREKLGGLLWSDRGETQARASLRQCLLELRNALHPHEAHTALNIGRDLVALDQARAVSDVQELLASLTQDDAAPVTAQLEAIGLGELLEDADVPGLFAEWRDVQRAWLEDRIAAGVQRHIELLEGRGDWTGLKALTATYLHRDSLNEPVVAAAMRADAALGSATSARRRYQVLQAAMERDYGAKPVGAAREALSAISRQAAVADAEPVETAHPSPDSTTSGEAAAIALLVAAFETSPSEHEPLVGSIREEIVSGLAHFRDLRVVTDPRPLAEVQTEGPSACITYILAGRLGGPEHGARLTVQLLRAADRQVLWSETLPLKGLHLDLAGGVDHLIARAVGAVLPTIQADVARHHGRTNGYHRYVLARDAAQRAETHAQARAAADLLAELVAEDPTFAPPHFALARLYNTDFGFTLAGSTGDAERARALSLAKAGLRADRGDVHGYTATGWCYLRQRRWEAAREHFEQALKLNPFYAGRVVEVGFGYVFLGDLDRARALLDRCLLLNPAPDDDFFADLGFLEAMRGDHDRAASYFELIVGPHLWAQVHGAINDALAGSEDSAGACAARDRIAGIWPTDRAPTDEAILEWIVRHHPFRFHEMEDRLTEGARQMLIRAQVGPQFHAQAQP